MLCFGLDYVNYLPLRSRRNFQTTAVRNVMEITLKIIIITNQNPSRVPTSQGSGSGGQGLGAGQLPEQSTQEQVPLVFYIP